MPKLVRYSPQSESELHIIIQSDLSAIEEGIDLLQHEYQSGKGFIDFLCVDSGRRLVIIEVKLNEDENVLFQGLRYFNDIDRNRYLVSSLFSPRVDPEEAPRLILIAEKFSEDIRHLSMLVVPEVELLEYSSVILPDGEKGIVYHSVSLPIVKKMPSEPTTIEKLIEYVTDERLKPLITEMRSAIKNIGTGIDEYATQSYIGYKHPCGRQFAYISVFRRAIEFGAHIIDKDRQLLDYEGIRVRSGDEDYSEILDKIKESYSNLD